MAKQDTKFPRRLLRGISKREYIELGEDGECFVLGKAFEPNWKTAETRSKESKSNHYESSINWEDSAFEAFNLLSPNQAATHGIAVVPLAKLERVKQVNATAREALAWERAVLKKNPYHGNILFNAQLSKPVLKMLAGVIATQLHECIKYVPPEGFTKEATQRKEAAVRKQKNALVRAQAAVKCIGRFLEKLWDKVYRSKPPRP